jgi:hypothetical protein
MITLATNAKRFTGRHGCSAVIGCIACKVLFCVQVGDRPVIVAVIGVYSPAHSLVVCKVDELPDESGIGVGVCGAHVRGMCM